MKKIFCLIILLSFLLCGCVNFTQNIHDSIELNGVIYKTGFYGLLYPNDFAFNGQESKINNLSYKQLSHESFDLYHANTGAYTSGTIYCNSNDYDEALTYYNDPKNFSYYCLLGDAAYAKDDLSIPLPDIDIEKFNSLLDFAAKSTYDPFDSNHNSKISKVELPMPDNKSNKIIFYKESIDSLFVSTQENEYYIIDNYLYLVYQYDYGHGEYEKLIAVKVPEEISEYFVEYMKSHVLKERS